jgi:hypothetical protein
MCEGWLVEIGAALRGSVVRRDRIEAAPTWLASVNSTYLSDRPDRESAIMRRKNERVRSTDFDGLWSVAIVTRDGTCDPSYRYPARVVWGRVVQADDDFIYQMYGAVNSRGATSVTVSRGGQNAAGYGGLSRSQGGGWRRSAGGQCSGIWTTFRRGWGWRSATFAVRSAASPPFSEQTTGAEVGWSRAPRPRS